MLTPAVVDSFRDRRIAVVGDALLDRFTDGHAERLCREGPVPLVRTETVRSYPGGAANVAANLAALGADVAFVSVVGEDPPGAELVAALQRERVSLAGLIRDAGRSTPQLNRVRADGQLLVRVDEGSASEVGAELAARLAGHVRDVAGSADAVIVSDYDRGTVADPVVAAAAGSGSTLVVDARHLARYQRFRPAVVKPNWAEAVDLIGDGGLDGTAERAGGIAGHGQTILELTGAQIAAVTLDRDGAVVFERGRPPHRTFSRPATETCATGAGDTFLAALTLALVSGLATPFAAEVASCAAGVALGEGHTARCRASALAASLGDIRKTIEDPSTLQRTLDDLRARGRRVVFTNGWFDGLHRGQVTLLDRARTLGDVLLVGVNADPSPRGGVAPLRDRLMALSALSCVDHVVPYGGDTACDVIAVVRPDLYVKGGDRARDSVPETAAVEALGGEVAFLPLMEDRVPMTDDRATLRPGPRARPVTARR